MKADDSYPLMTIGVPVFNEERFIDSALTSLRGQDYPNLEIIIADNASTDRTLEICKRHALEDTRIRIETTEINRGAVANFGHVLDMASGAYFMWAAGHDLWTSNLVSECISLLEDDARACLAFASSRWIGVDSEPLAMASGWSDTRDLAAAARFFTIFWGNMHPVMGVMRTHRMRECSPMPGIVGGDLVFLADLSLRGSFLHAAKSCWSRREFRLEKHHDDKLKRYASDSTGIIRTRFTRMFPLLKLPFALIKVVLRSGISIGDKLGIIIALMPSLLLRYVVGRRGHAE
ncbi:glycosyltransferase family 2 protein [Rhodanobacter sp. L36]|uniref:glycosyltransferase family 2 protein n=1 Tax=Rhodanobacter sp. L36 TaxID=1747221 RepID=UPI00131D901F|nr:glycosyltransferase family 2 protein [Rhodanobacter sp. L36]